MKINFKNILIIDFIIICSVVTFFFNGQKITDAFAFGPEKPIYKTFVSEIESLKANAKSLDPDTLNKKISDINTEFINRSEVLYGVKLDGIPGSVDKLEQALEKMNTQHVYQGEIALFEFHIGELIKSETNSAWIYNSGDGKFYLESQKNHEKLSPYYFVFDRYLGSDESAQSYIDESIKKLGGKK